MTKFNKDITNVIVINETDADVFEEVAEMYEGSMHVFEKQKGFLGGTLLRSEESNKIVGVLQWESLADHKACMESPDWFTLPNGKRWMELTQSGKLRAQPEAYSILKQTN